MTTGSASDPLGSGPRPPLVARERELATLVGALPAPGCGAAAVLVGGPPGVGKSALLAAAAAALAPVPVRCAVAGPDLATGGLARRLVPELVAAPEPSTPRARRRHWTRPLLASLATGPLVLVVDQVDRADGVSLAWLDHLLRRARELPLLVLMTRRTRTVPRAPGPFAELATRPVCRELELGRLGPSGTLRLLREAGLVDVDAEAADGCAELGMGVPRVIQQLAVELRDTDHTTLLARVRARRGATVRARARAEVAAGTPQVAAVVRALAVLGTASYELLGAVAGVARPEVVGALAVLGGDHVIDHDPEAGTVALRMPEMAEGALADLDADATTALRRRAAERLCDAGAPVERVAAQLMRIPPEDGADGWMRQVVRMAATAVSVREGPGAVLPHVEWLTAAAGAAGAGEEAGFSEFDARLARGCAHLAPDRAVVHLVDALGVADPRTGVALAIELAVCLAAGGQAAEGASILRDESRRARQGDEVSSDDPLLTAADVMLDHLAATRRSVVPRPAGERPRTAGPLRGSAVVVLRAVAMRAGLACRHADREPAEAAALARRALTGSPHPPPGVVVPAATALHLSGASVEAGDAWAAALASVEGADGATAELPARYALWHLDRGDVAGALSALGMSADVVDADHDTDHDTDHHAEPVLTVLAGAAALLAADRVDLARRRLDRIDEADVDDVDDLRLLHGTRARVALHDGDADTAERLLARGAAVATEAGVRNPLDVPLWRSWALLLHDRDRGTRARQVLDGAEEMVRSWPTGRALGVAGTVRGVLEGGVPGVATLTDAVERLADDGSAGDAARARILLGRLLVAVGHEREARGVLREAAEESMRRGAAALARQARDELVVAGGRMRAPTGHRHDALTGTQRKVAELVARGASNREVADELVVSLRTVEQHLTHAYRKLGVRGRRDLERLLAPAGPGEGS